jgi:septal ring factor EnvC (AmiA/AmiB activator)
MQTTYRFISIIALSLLFTVSYGQTNAKVAEMESQRSKLEQEINESKQLLTSAEKDTESQLAALSALTAQIKKQQQFVNQLDADIRATDREIRSIEEQLITLQAELERRKEHYAHALRLMTAKNTFENRLMFLLSAESFNQMVRRMRYLREYSTFQQKQGEALMAKQEELNNKRAELEHTRKAKQNLLIKRVEEKRELDARKAEQQKLVGNLKKKQKEIRERIARQQKERNKLNEEINRIIEAEIAARNAEQQKADGKTGDNGKPSGTAMPVYRQNAADKKLSGSFESNKGKLPVPITGPYLITSHYGVNYVEGLKNVKYNNNGIDIRGQQNCQARAVFDGTVSFIFEHPQIQGSYIVMVRHGQYISAYFNLTALKVESGDKVKINQPLGLIRPDASGSYIMQFQLRKDTQSLNPEHWVAL